MTFPLHGLVLRTPLLELRGMTEADALLLGERQPADVSTAPGAPRIGYDVPQTYWRHLGSWRVEDWALPFTVLLDGQPVGVQALEGKDFLVRRVVDSYSWLLPSARGRGVGTHMRSAVLTLAFQGLGASWAVSEADEGNAASLGVSRRLGYEDNGTSIELDDDPSRAVRRQHLLLAAERFRAPWEVTIEGLEPCLPLFGLSAGEG